MGRARKAKTRRITVGIPEDLLLEMMTLVPGMVDPLGFTRYGALSSYMAMLIRKDMNERKLAIADAASAVSAEASNG